MRAAIRSLKSGWARISASASAPPSPWLAADEARRLVKAIEQRWPGAPRESSERSPEAVSGGVVDRRGGDTRRKPQSKQPAFDLTRLKLGNRYEFQLCDGSSLVGVLRRIDYPQGLGGENVDGNHPVQVTQGAVEQFLSSKEIVAVRRRVADAP
ncbi:MAG: hypothetical protein LBJ87_05880 [bacterium]|nr:hypothetical protein [bacterium]